MEQILYLVNQYEETAVYQAVCKALDALHVMDDITSDMKVVLKPNLIQAKKPEAAPVTTHPLIIKSVSRYLYEHGIHNVTIAESSGGPYTAEAMKTIYRVCGVEHMEPYAKLNMDFGFQSVNAPDGFTNHSFNLINPIVEADYIINLPKLKTHAMTGYSGGIKNLFGTIPGLQKPQLHYRFPDIENFSNMLLELSLVVHPQVTLIDAIDAMEGNGPTGGTSHPLHMLLASRDMYTQDFFATKLMGIEPAEIVMIRQAMERGLVHPEEMTLIGDSVPDDLTAFLQPDTKSLDFTGHVPKLFRKPFTWVASHVLKSYPTLDKEHCIGCGKCAESCPAHIIEIKNKKAVFKKRGCISCFCCQEMCPMKAISVKKAL
jgi:uncharacterized protein (DUF362 family)/ferredoxin